MALGKAKTGLNKRVDLEIPTGAPLTKKKGTTGLQLPRMINIEGTMKLFPKWKSHSPGDTMQFIQNQSLRYGKYIEEIWDCEDHAYLAAADVRRAFPGQPIGILLGKGTDGGENIVGREHAINVLWFEKDVGDGKKEWFARFFDATLRREIKVDPPIETDYVIPCPICGSDKQNEYKDFSPYENFDFLPTATFALDRIGYDFNSLDSIEKQLTEWRKTGYAQLGLSEIDAALFTPSDMVFYYFAHIRRWYADIRQPHPPTAAPPVGVAFGKIGNDDYGVLILWKSKDEYIYWDIYGGAVVDQLIRSGPNKFEPRVILV